MEARALSRHWLAITGRLLLWATVLGLMLAPACRLTAGAVATAASPPSERTPQLASSRPLAELLNPDGTLDLTTGFRGSLDVAGWRLVSGPLEPPRFSPSSSSDDDLWWARNFGLPGTNHTIEALALDGGNLYAGGRFTQAGGVDTNYIAMWNGSSWSALGTGVSGGSYTTVYALAIDGSGNVYAGGDFTHAGGVEVNGVAKWNGSSWSALGSGLSGAGGPIVYALAVDDGNLYAGGLFASAGGVQVNRIAKWNGTSWSGLGSGTTNTVLALALDGSGNLYAGGYFTTIGGVSANRIAKWDGSNWYALGSGTNDPVRAVAVDQSGNVYAGGEFTTAGAGSANYIAKWDGDSWSALDTGMSSWVLSLTVDGNNLYAGGAFDSAGGADASLIAKWDGSSWSALGSGMQPGGGVDALVVDGNGNLYAAGLFSTAGGRSVGSISMWDGSDWSGGGGTNGPVYALAVDDLGNVYTGGDFTAVAAMSANHIARWDGNRWFTLGTGSNNGVNGAVRALVLVQGGPLYAGGDFTTAGGVSANRIAKWGGGVWSALGSGPSNGVNNTVRALAVYGGKVYVGGDFTTAGGASAAHVARWFQNSWSRLGSAANNGVNNTVRALATDGSGNVYVGGDFNQAGGSVTASHVAMWDGSSWSSVGTGTSGTVRSLALDDSGNLWAGGDFAFAGGCTSNYISTWNGSWWSCLLGLNGPVHALAVKDGNVYFGGDFSATFSGTPASYIVMRDAGGYSALGSGMDGGVRALAFDGGGDLYVGGEFDMAGGRPSFHMGRWSLHLTHVPLVLREFP